MILIDCQKVHVIKSGTIILEDISLKIYRAETLIIVGPNGGGKTTLIKLLTGLLRPDIGCIAKNPDLKISYMPQQLNIPHQLPLTVIEFMALYNIKKNDLLHASINLEPILNKNIHELSGGERRKMLFVATILIPADIIAIDEPEQNLDTETNGIMREMLSQENAKGKAVIIVSHDHKTIFSQNNKAIYLAQSILYNGDTSSDELMALYHGHPCVSCHIG